MADARKIAALGLLRVEKDSAYSNILLSSLFEEFNASKEDRSLASAIFYGVLDRQITLDYYINKYSKIPAKKLSPYTRQVLRSAFYQMYFMDKIPVSAAVNEAVKLVKNSDENKNFGYVNAVLRNASKEKLSLPDGRDLYSISVRYSCPQWILSALVNDYGIERTEEILKTFLSPAKVFLRTNTLKISSNKLLELFNENEISATLIDENTFELTSGIDFSKNKLFSEGLFHIQDISSQKCAEALLAKSGERILDVCSAPGGKSFTVAEVMEDSGEIISCDLYENRVSLIKKGAHRLGIKSITAIKNDATVYNSRLGEFDAVLCDVPCSGFGVIRRKPEIKYKPITDFNELQDIQLNILKTSANYVKKDGRLLYSTCTLRKAENEGIVEQFLKDNSDFNCEYMHTFIPSANNDGFFHAMLKHR